MTVVGTGNEYQHLYKILLIGDAGVGKSCLLRQFADSKYDDCLTSTIGVDFKIKTIQLNGKNIKLQIWDSAGQERYRTLASAYYRGAHGVGIVFDVTNEESFQNVPFWLGEVEKNQCVDVRRLLVGNKNDLDEKRRISYDQAEELASEHNMNYVETSAKTSENVANAFTAVAKEIFDAG